METNRAFDFIAFPAEVPRKEPLTGHDRLHDDRYHGSLTLKLTALTPVSISSGITVLGSDIGKTEPLIRIMAQDQNGYPVLQGTSLKGCIRAVYETITNSSVGVSSTKAPPSHKPQSIDVKNVARRSSQLSPAELVFGALGFQGLISIADAIGDRPIEIGYLPPMFKPERGRGRKFYRHYNSSSSDRSVSDRSAEADKPPTPIQQAPTGTVFTTMLRFANLTPAQLGALLVALGQDRDRPFALKLGAGKGKGLGSLAIQISAYQITKGDTLTIDRYLSYRPNKQNRSDSFLIEAIHSAYEMALIHSEQLEALWNILKNDHG